MKSTQWTSAVLVMVALTACASGGSKSPSAQSQAAKQDAKPVQTHVQFDSTKEIAYSCGKDRILVMYGIKDNIVGGAQLLYKNGKSGVVQTPLMLRTTNAKYNEFSTSGRHITWTQNLAAPSALESTAAKGLTMSLVDQKKYEETQGKEGMAIGVIADNCKVDSAMTKKIAASDDADMRVKWIDGK